jgi:competence protein ComEC
MKAFTNIPFFRILIPFILGILTAILVEVPTLSSGYFFLLLIPINFLKVYQPGNKTYKWLFLIFTDVFLFSFAMHSVQLKDLSKQKSLYSHVATSDSLITFIAAINDVPLEKETFIKCELSLLEVRSDTSYLPCKGTVLAYFKKSENLMSLKPGQTLLVKTKLQDVSEPKNPFEFNYKNYLINKQIYHTAYLDSNQYVSLPISGAINPVWLLGLNCKAFLLKQLKNSRLTKNAFGICAALITGYDNDIDKSVMQAFSHSGTLHVLSVSGLHTGLIYLALNFLFNFIDRKKKYKLSRLIFITVFLWFFALITGFSAPVLRAVIMFNLLGFGRIYFRAKYAHQLNILLVSAFILLVYNPFFIMDVGFLLSYFALFGLLYLQPKFAQLVESKNKFFDYFWQSITASLAATISTLPITLFYFKQFPLWFFVCNIVVVPATFIILILTLLLIIKLNFVTIILNAVVAFLIWFINLLDKKNLGYIDSIHFNLLDVVFLTALLIFLALAFQYRSFKQSVISLIVLLVWQIVSVWESARVKNESLLTVYNIRNSSVFSLKNKTLVSLSTSHHSAYDYSIKPQLNSFNYIKKDVQGILFLNKPNFWPDINYSEVTTLILANNFKITKQDLKKFKHLETIVGDASNNNYSLARMEELSRNFGLNFHNTKYKGAYLLEL